jgi:hypothetical protein
VVITQFSLSSQEAAANRADKETSMNRFGLAPVTLLTLTLTSLLLPYSGWFESRGSARSPSHAESRSSTRPHDLTTEAALRCRSAQPTHWRTFVLHH